MLHQPCLQQPQQQLQRQFHWAAPQAGCLLGKLGARYCPEEPLSLTSFSCTFRGGDWDTEIHGTRGATVKGLLVELYGKVGATRQWALIRYISGILKKKVEALDEVMDLDLD